MNEKELTAEIENLKNELTKLKETANKDTKSEFWIKLISSILLPLAITVSGYWFSQVIKDQEIKQSQVHDRLDSLEHEQQMSISLQNQRLENFKFITPYLEIIANAQDPKKRVLATKLILAIMPNEGSQLLSTAISNDPNNSKEYQATVDSTQQTLVANLFSDNPSIRINSANDIMVSWYKTASIVPILISYAKGHTDNKNGLYNSVVVLQNMHGSVLKSNKDAIKDFLKSIIQLPNMGKTSANATALNTALDKM